MTALHYRSRILMGGAVALAALLTTFVIMGAVLPAEIPMSSNSVPPDRDTGLTVQRAVRIARQHGVDSAFLAELSAWPSTSIQPRVLKINVTNFAQKADYSHNHNKASVQKLKEFIRNNDSLLTASGERYKVPPEVIASILWVETKCGAVMGNTHVPSVYLSLMLCIDSSLIEQFTESALVDLKADSTKHDSLHTIIRAKAAKKRAWAVDQLKALDSIHREGTLDIMRLRGSWAGAFGLSQFLPSSYRRWAIDGNSDQEINLDHLSDAAHSIANYLAQNGWGTTTKEQRAAVKHYNNSEAYVDAVLTLASKVEN